MPSTVTLAPLHCAGQVGEVLVEVGTGVARRVVEGHAVVAQVDADARITSVRAGVGVDRVAADRVLRAAVHGHSVAHIEGDDIALSRPRAADQVVRAGDVYAVGLVGDGRCAVGADADEVPLDHAGVGGDPHAVAVVARDDVAQKVRSRGLDAHAVAIVADGRGPGKAGADIVALDQAARSRNDLHAVAEVPRNQVPVARGWSADRVARGRPLDGDSVAAIAQGIAVGVDGVGAGGVGADGVARDDRPGRPIKRDAVAQVAGNHVAADRHAARWRRCRADVEPRRPRCPRPDCRRRPRRRGCPQPRWRCSWTRMKRRCRRCRR